MNGLACEQFPVNGLDLSPYVVKDPGGSGGGGGKREAEAASVASANGTAGVGVGVGVGGPPNDSEKGAFAVAVDAGAGAGAAGVKGSGGTAVPPVVIDPAACRSRGSDAPPSLLPNGGGGGGVSDRTLPNGLPAGPGAPSDIAGGGAEAAKDGEGEPLLTPGTGEVEADAGGGAGGESDGDGGVGMAGAGVIGADVREKPSRVLSRELIFSATTGLLECVSTHRFSILVSFPLGHRVHTFIAWFDFDFFCCCCARAFRVWVPACCFRLPPFRPPLASPLHALSPPLSMLSWCCPLPSQGRARGFLVRLVRRGAPPGGVELGALRGVRQEPALREVALFQRRSGED